MASSVGRLIGKTSHVAECSSRPSTSWSALHWQQPCRPRSRSRATLRPRVRWLRIKAFELRRLLFDDQDRRPERQADSPLLRRELEYRVGHRADKTAAASRSMRAMPRDEEWPVRTVPVYRLKHVASRWKPASTRVRACGLSPVAGLKPRATLTRRRTRQTTDPITRLSAAVSTADQSCATRTPSSR